MFTSVSCLPSDVTVNVPRYAFLNTSGVCDVKTSGPRKRLQLARPGTLNASSGLSVILPAGIVIAAAEPSLIFHGAVEEIVMLGVCASSTRMLFTVVVSSFVPGK